MATHEMLGMPAPDAKGRRGGGGRGQNQHVDRYAHLAPSSGKVPVPDGDLPTIEEVYQEDANRLGRELCDLSGKRYFPQEEKIVPANSGQSAGKRRGRNG